MGRVARMYRRRALKLLERCRVAAVMALALFVPLASAIAADKPPTQANAIGVVVNLDRSGLQLDIALTARVAFRMSFLSAPKRLVIDANGLDWGDLVVPELPENDWAAQIRVGRIEGTWARLVLDLKEPMRVEEASYVDHDDGALVNRIRLVPDSESAFAKAVAASARTATALRMGTNPQDILKVAPRDEDLKPLIAIDPGHGGIDPGAINGGLTEKALNLAFAITLSNVLEASGRYQTVLTRSDDSFVPLRRRVGIASSAGASVFLSIHVNTVEVGRASGLSLFSLSDTASDKAARQFAEFENNADVFAGFDAKGTESVVAMVLVDIAQRETNARSRLLASELVDALSEGETLLRTRPHRQAGFVVLRSPAMPSILLELGFMSNDEDLDRLRDFQWQSKVANEMLHALDRWVEADREQRKLTRR